MTGDALTSSYRWRTPYRGGAPMVRGLTRNHRPGAFVGEDLMQQRVPPRAVDDVSALYSAANQMRNCCDLRQHPCRNCAFAHQSFSFFNRQPRDSRRRISAVAQNSIYVRQQDELLGLQVNGDLGGNRVGVDVINVSLFVSAQR